MTKQEASFGLDYIHFVDNVQWGEWRTEQVYLMRSPADRRLGETEDSFLAYRLRDDAFLGCGDTKDEALAEARYSLMDASRAAIAA